jgi:hypothetical protein
MYPTRYQHNRSQVVQGEASLALTQVALRAEPNVATRESLVTNRTRPSPNAPTRILLSPHSVRWWTDWCLARSRLAWCSPQPKPNHKATKPSSIPPIAPSAAPASPRLAAGHAVSPPGVRAAAEAGARVRSGAGRRGMSSSRRPAGSRVPTTPLTDGGR